MHRKHPNMNIFQQEAVALEYDRYYTTDWGKQVDRLEKAAIRELIKDITPGKMLEIGCGTGHWTAFFSGKGFQITAIDISPAMLAVARRKHLANVTFMEADAMQLPFADEAFDQVAAITTLEFCSDRDRVLSEMARILKHGGLLLAGCLNARSALGESKHQDPVLKHAQFMTREELVVHLSSLGDPRVLECVYLSREFEILDNTEKQDTVAGAFIAAAVEKCR
jgi:ubiquinone/menaquinone biosynthesis C-methylase UbiE